MVATNAAHSEGGHGVANKQLVEFQRKILNELKELRETLEEERKQVGNAASESIVAERDALLKENAKLKYRINHLLRSLEEAEAKAAK